MKVSYSTYYSFKDKDGQKHSMTSQLYQVGVYLILNNNSSLQASSTPQKMKKVQDKLRKDEVAGRITELVLGPEITVSDDSGLWKEVVSQDEIFVQKGMTYKSKSQNTKKVYHFTITELVIGDERTECMVTFTSSPKCDELSKCKIDDNTFKANIFSFQSSVELDPKQ